MRGVIFDFDGVLVDSEAVHEAAIRRVAEPLGMTFTHDRFVNEFVGTTDEHCFRTLASSFEKPLPDDQLRQLIEEKRAGYHELLRQGEVKPYPGSVELARALAQRGPLGLCSGSHRETVLPTLERLSIQHLFTTIVTSDSVAKPKPDPEGYRLATERLGLEPGQVSAIEDSPPGAKAATAAGLRVFVVGHTFPAARFPSGTRYAQRIADLNADELLQTGPAEPSPA